MTGRHAGARKALHPQGPLRTQTAPAFMQLRTNAPMPGRPVDYEGIKARAYHDQGIAIIDLADSRIPWQDREIIEMACKKLYGRKAG